MDSPRESPEQAAERVLSLWESLVGFNLGEVRRRVFLRRPEVVWLARQPRRLIETWAKSAIAANPHGHLLLAEWVGAATPQDDHDPL
ncbi:hypothetical protein [Nocardioides sp. J54]|uniref:hypothetical protein n=1 Tax=Nocardioides sp. J54 TaxID=935866 RepID=UPI0012FB8ED6|nr:hypothetical protein [Nocardioides sp. J54]